MNEKEKYEALIKFVKSMLDLELLGEHWKGMKLACERVLEFSEFLNKLGKE